MSAKLEYARSIAHDYLGVIETIESGRFDSDRELRYLEGERATLHAQLVRAIGRRIRKDDMPQYARSLLR